MTRVADQPQPRVSTGAEVWPEVIARAEAEGLSPDVIADMRERDQVGRDRYAMPLRRGDGRDHLVDAYQEALDLCAYLTSACSVDSALPGRARDLARDIRVRLAPCGACGSLRAIGSAVCSRCGSTC